MQDLIRISISLLPVFVFLAGLNFIDSFKLVKPQTIFISIFAGCCAAILSFFLNSYLLEAFDPGYSIYTRYFAPVVEESFKAVFLIYLIHTNRMGFMVDSAICGFAIGAGFAFLENIHYLRALDESAVYIWVARGFGTAIMHGGATAVLGILAKNLYDRKSDLGILMALPGLLMAIAIHSLYNHFILPAVYSAILIMVSFPIIITAVYKQSEKATKHWLGVGFDSDQELLELIITGNLSDSRIGRYLHSLKDRFKGEIVADMLCLLRIHLELSIRAKGILMMKESGFKPVPDPMVKAKFEEMKYLEKSIGATGQLAIMPFLHTNNRDLWQLHMLTQG